MTPEELAATEARCTSRLAELARRGITVGQLSERYLIHLLEIHLSAEEVHAAKVEHFSELEAYLDRAEAEIRAAVLTQGVSNGRRH